MIHHYHDCEDRKNYRLHWDFAAEYSTINLDRYFLLSEIMSMDMNFMMEIFFSGKNAEGSNEKMYKEKALTRSREFSHEGERI
jgi:hypothetical protein